MMVKKMLSVMAAVTLASALSVSVMAEDVDVTGNTTYIRPGDKLGTGSGNYQTVLVTSENAELDTLTADDIFYINQATDSVSAFLNMGLKGGLNVGTGKYKMYLVDQEGNQTQQIISVTDTPQEGTKGDFEALAGEGSTSEVYKQGESFAIDKGYKISFVPAQFMTSYKLTINCNYNGKTISYDIPADKLPAISGAGSFNFGVQINGIPCDADGNISGAEFTVSFIPLY